MNKPDFTVHRAAFPNTKHRTLWILESLAIGPVLVCEADLERYDGGYCGIPKKAIFEAIKQKLAEEKLQTTIAAQFEQLRDKAGLTEKDPPEAVMPCILEMLERKESSISHLSETLRGCHREFRELRESLEDARGQAQAENIPAFTEVKSVVPGEGKPLTVLCIRNGMLVHRETGLPPKFADFTEGSLMHVVSSGWFSEMWDAFHEKETESPTLPQTGFHMVAVSLLQQLQEAAGGGEIKPEVAIPVLISEAKEWRRSSENWQRQAEELDRSSSYWKEVARRHCNNEFYYRSLVERIGLHFGTDAFTSDDGSVQQDILNAKIPELFENFLKRVLPLVATRNKASLSEVVVEPDCCRGCSDPKSEVDAAARKAETPAPPVS